MIRGFVSFYLFDFQEIRRDFQAEAERMEFEAELKKKEREKSMSREQQEYGKNKRWRFQIKLRSLGDENIPTQVYLH